MNISEIIRVADKVNAKRRKEVLSIYRNSYIFDYIKEARKSGVFEEGKKDGVRMRKVATIPLEVDIFFTRIYGPQYYKDPEFFDRVAPEWRVVGNFAGSEEDNINHIAQGFRND